MRFALLALLLVGCAHTPKPVHGDGWRDARGSLTSHGIALTPVTFAADLPAPPLPVPTADDAVLRLQDDAGPEPTVLDPADPRHAAFLRNDHVGNVRFGGGFVQMGTVGMDVRARIVELGEDDAYRAQASEWLGGLVDQALDSRRVRVHEVAALDLPGPRRHRFRGRHPDDGRDNVNLPRTHLSPAPLDEATRAAARAAGASDLLLVPIVRSYLTHNAGWFVGQRWGCMSGARAEVLLTLYDLEDGEPVWWLATEGVFRDGPAVPSISDLDQALLQVESEIEEVVRKRMLR